jgi:hypothetical protein
VAGYPKNVGCFGKVPPAFASTGSACPVLAACGTPARAGALGPQLSEAPQGCDARRHHDENAPCGCHPDSGAERSRGRASLNPSVGGIGWRIRSPCCDRFRLDGLGLAGDDARHGRDHRRDHARSARSFVGSVNGVAGEQPVFRQPAPAERACQEVASRRGNSLRRRAEKAARRLARRRVRSARALKKRPHKQQGAARGRPLVATPQGRRSVLVLRAASSARSLSAFAAGFRGKLAVLGK